MMRPARWGCEERNSATNLVLVTPKPIPASSPNMPTVLWIMPNSPKPATPSARPTRAADTTPTR